MPQRTLRAYFREVTKTTNADGTINPGDRFLSTDEPSEETMKRLIESCAFISEIDDAAKDTEQGLVKVVSDSNAKNGIEPTDGATYAAQIKNLPKIKEETQSLLDFSGKIICALADPLVSSRNEYISSMSADFLSWLGSRITSIESSISSISVPDVSGIIQDIDDINANMIIIDQSIVSINSDLASKQLEIDTLKSEMEIVEAQAQQNSDDIALLSVADGSVIGEYKFMPVLGAPNSSYLLCDGSEISRTTYTDLFSKIGTTFGAGNGSTTFNIPDFSGKGIRGYDALNPSDFGVGVSKGSDETTIGVNNLPQHQHPFTPSGDSISLADGVGSDVNSVAKGDGTGSDSITISGGGTVENNSSSEVPFSVVNPYLTTVVYIKAL